ncbi:GNAT family N-acetyltransferase [Geodermatophilus sp. YIM 151500]|uniref:GNAT family N-acetyltransferase n=1 Tax=Geodermatophilus sp. YIM 151500 TaxID=2984531 RepID=UPI0021E37F8A|nr:GNAT family N-acetyltransferase [Geodermatophilus sp. YIM 151500]MCV2487804.1 GNAT family N-acetyltransferase [Geodermatophilus sp. YIM 151500]
MDVVVPTRPVSPDDLPRFGRLWPRLSPDTVYRRFHAPLRSLPPETVRRFVEVDHDRREAVVATLGDEVIGVARYDRSPDDPGTAEFAIVVEDAWQGAGVGRQLLVELVDLAARRGVHTFTATVQPDNERVLGLIRRVLPGSTLHPDGDVVEVRSPLRPPAAAAPAAVPPEPLALSC